MRVIGLVAMVMAVGCEPWTMGDAVLQLTEAACEADVRCGWESNVDTCTDQLMADFCAELDCTAPTRDGIRREWRRCTRAIEESECVRDGEEYVMPYECTILGL